MAYKPKEPFVFVAETDDVGAKSVGSEERQARATEYIAMYLDRIESHLEAIAATLATGNDNASATAQALNSIAQVMPRLVPGR